MNEFLYVIQLHFAVFDGLNMNNKDAKEKTSLCVFTFISHVLSFCGAAFPLFFLLIEALGQVAFLLS